MKPYFVMLYSQNGTHLIPLMDGKEVEELAGFDTIDDARYAAQKTLFGQSFGFEVYEVGGGVYLQ